MYKDDTCPVSSPNNLEMFLEEPKIKRYSLEVYNAEDELLGYSFAYGDCVKITFKLEDYLIDMLSNGVELKDFVKDKSVDVNIFDSRSNFITSLKNLEIDELYNCSFTTTEEFSEELLSKCKPLDYYGKDNVLLSDNVYTCVLNLVNNLDNTSVRFMSTRLYLIRLYNKTKEID